MSIFFEFDVNSNGRRFRRAVDDDRFHIQLILAKQDHSLFGDVDIGSLIELSYLSICMVDEAMEVVGFMALCDRPNVPAVEPSHWEMWIRNMYQKFYLSRNTLFIHMMCCTGDYDDVFVEECLVSVFRNDAYLQQIVLLVPPSCPPSHLTKHRIFKKGMASKVPARINDENEIIPYMYVFLRHNVCPKLRIRSAVQEDNDDVVEILDKLSPQLKEEYGNFYISEIIGFNPDSKRKILVADQKDKAVGVMCLNSEINYKMIHEMYELRAFYGLNKSSAVEQEKAKRDNYLLTVFGEPVMSGAWSPFSEIYQNKQPLGNRKQKNKIRNAKDRKNPISKVSFDERKRLKRLAEFDLQGKRNDSPKVASPAISATMSDYSDIAILEEIKLLLDEDPFDYEIVNIDKNLLTVPEAFSSINLDGDLSFSKKHKGRRRSSIRNTELLNRLRKRRASLHRPIKVEDNKHLTIGYDYGNVPNAFIIELFGLQDYIHQSHAFEFLEVAFDIMDSFDYCLIRIPCTETHPMLQYFTFVPMKSGKCLEYALYVTHRNSIHGRLRVRKAEFVDIPSVAQLLQREESKETMWNVQKAIQSNKGQAYVLYCGIKLVGLTVLQPTDHIDFKRARYNLDPYYNDKYHLKGQNFERGFGTIQSMVVYTVFQPHGRFFIREVLRHSGYNSLLWLSGRRHKAGLHRFNNMLELMIPLVPRNYCLYDFNIKELRRFYNLNKNSAPFMLWFISMRFTSITKATVDARIVLIGASRTAMAFINTLIFSDPCTYLTFNSVTLISPNGLPFSKRPHSHAEMMFPKYSNTYENNFKSVPYQYYINVIEGTMVEINKLEKNVVLSDGSKCHYDLLFLLFGYQYQCPDYMKSVKLKDQTMRASKLLTYLPLDSCKFLEKHTTKIYYPTPANVFIVNDIADASKALNYISGLYWESPDFKVVVYGASIHAYCCLATLLDMGIDAEKIIFVEPFPPENPKKTRVPIFSNVYVNNSIREILNDYGITVYRSYYFQSWTLDERRLVSHVEFLSHFHMIRLECTVFFYYGKIDVNEEAFLAMALNKSGIGFNSGVLIDHEFRTKDPSILAAGPCTRYYSKYFAEDRRQKYFDSYEIGEKLGVQIRNQLDPMFCPTYRQQKQSVSFSKKINSFIFIGDAKNQTETILGKQNRQESRDKTLGWKLPDLRKPLVTYCVLPGNLQYLDVRPPGYKTPHHYLQSLNYNGFVMETMNHGYFKLHCTNDYIVDGITCLTPANLRIEKFKNLYGFSTVVLNHVFMKYATKKIDNFYEFFGMPWAQFLYYDNLHELLAMVQELYPMGIENKETLREGLISKADKYGNSSFRTSMSNQLRYNFEKTPYIEAITNYVIEWLTENDLLLPFYLQKWYQAEILHDIDRHDAFTKPKPSTTSKKIDLNIA